MTTLTESFQRLAALSAAGRLPEGVEVTALPTGGTFYVDWDNQEFPVRIIHAEREGLDIYPYAMGALMLLVQALKPSGWRFQRLAIIGSESERWCGVSPDYLTDLFHFTDSTNEPAALAACIVAAVKAGGEN